MSAAHGHVDPDTFELTAATLSPDISDQLAATLATMSATLDGNGSARALLLQLTVFVVAIGLGRIVALYYRSSTLYQIH